MLGDPMTDLSVALEVDYFRMARDRYFVPVTVKIPGCELELAHGTGVDSTKIDFIGEVRDAKGVVQGNVRDYQEIKLKGESAGTALQAHPRLRHGLHPAARKLHPQVPHPRKRDRQDGDLRNQVRDSRSHHPAASTCPSRASCSAISGRIMSTALATAEKDKKLLAANPLVQNNQKLVPSVTRVFKKDQDMFVYLQAYQPDAQTTQPLVATVSFYRGKVKAFETAPLADHRRPRRQDQGPAHPLQRAARQAAVRAATPARSACSIRKPRSSPSGAPPS